MRVLTMLLTMAALLLTASIPGLAKPVLNPAGTYRFVLSNSSVQGKCPMGRNGAGTLGIVKTPKGYSLQYLRGMTCRPASVCVLYGGCRGGACLFSTTVTVDSEGGKVTNTAKLRFAGRGGNGTGRSVYRHPSGFSCTWTYSLLLTK